MKTRLLVLALLATPLFAAPPRIVNGSLQTVASLAQAPGDGWIGYSITTEQNVQVSCCPDWNTNWRCNNCRLEGDNNNMQINRPEKGDLAPVGANQVALFARFEEGSVRRVRIFSPDCELDASGQSIRWVENVSAAQSIAFLRSAIDNGTKKGRDSALLALSLQSGGTDALIDIAKRGDRETRGKALFWLSQHAGRKAASALRDAVDNDPEDEVRQKAVFGISQLPNDQSIPMLVELMKTHRSPGVRKKAAFWLGQKNDPRALAAIEDILR